MISPKQAAYSLTVPTSTIRRWSVRFASHLSTQTKPGQRRSYTPGDLDVFRRIRDLSGQGVSLARIDELLDVVEKPVDTGTALLSLADFTQALESAQSQIAQFRQMMTDQAAKIDEQTARIQRLEDWLKLPFWKRVGRRPPTSE